VVGGPEGSDGNGACDRAGEGYGHQPAQPRSSGVTKQYDAGDAGHHRLTDDEGRGGTVY
jgi:hypothetical protein